MAPIYKLKETFFSQEEIENRAEEIGAQITVDYEGKDLVLIGILRGAVMWMTQVMKYIDNPKATIDFMAVSSYGASTVSSGVVKINMDTVTDLNDKHVIIVEDIVDTGVTLDYLIGYIKGKNPASVSICTLLDKPAGRKKEVDVKYVGFEVPDMFVVGYGLDVNQQYRTLPYITFVEVEEE